ncbi:MAG: hypothetical protein WBS24_06470 [Terriglobales bacterium]
MPGNSRWSSRAVVGAILFFGLLAMTARSATDPDLWWHLRTGQWIVETGHVPHTDPFSFTRAGSPWVAHEWLSDVIFYALWRLAGPAALIVFSSFVTTAGFLLLYFRCPGKPHWAAAATVLGAVASAPCWGTRPQMFTFLLASLFLWLLERAEERPRLLLWMPPLFLFWLNLHGGFALGPVLLLLYAAGLVLEVAAGTTPWPQARAVLTRVLLAALACIALIPVNPNGVRLYRYPLETVRATELRLLIVEWLSPDFHLGMYLPFLVVLLLLMASLAWSRASIRGRVLMPLVFMLLSALDAVRHIPIFILLAMPVITQALSRGSQGAQLSARRRPIHRFRPVVSWIPIVALALFACWRWTYLIDHQNVREAELFPRDAIAFLRAGHSPNAINLFAYYDWGGYAIWNLYPQYRVFADGRTDLYGDEVMKQAVEIALRLHRGWQAVLDDWKVEIVLIQPSSALAQALALDPGWRISYQDAQAIIFARRGQNLEIGVTSGTNVKSTPK